MPNPELLELQHHHAPNILAISDTHAGSIYSPVNPDTKIRSADGTHFHPENRTAVQDWLWQIWLKVIEAAMDLPDLTLVHLGDMCQGDRHPGELISDNIAHQPELAIWTLEPLLALPNLKRVELIAGTGAHTEGQAALELITMNRIKQERPDIQVDLAYHKVFYTGGGCTPFLDASHHGPTPGIYIHTAGNVARNHLRNLMLQEILSRNAPAKYYLRGHFHQYQREFAEVGEYYSQMILLPSLTGANEYAQKAGKSPAYIGAGGVIIQGDNVTKVIQTLDIRQRSILD